MSKGPENHRTSEVLVLRTQRCRKSEAVIRFLAEEHIPHQVLYLEKNPFAQELARKWNIKSSPGIIIGDRHVLATDILENCRNKNREQTKRMFLTMINEVKKDQKKIEAKISIGSDKK